MPRPGIPAKGRDGYSPPVLFQETTGNQSIDVRIIRPRSSERFLPVLSGLQCPEGIEDGTFSLGSTETSRP
jgi:hypothetical protein